jgi:hypothetical protein
MTVIFFLLILTGKIGGCRPSTRKGRLADGGGSRAGAGQQNMARVEASSHPRFGDRLGVGFLTCWASHVKKLEEAGPIT